MTATFVLILNQLESPVLSLFRLVGKVRGEAMQCLLGSGEVRKLERGAIELELDGIKVV